MALAAHTANSETPLAQSDAAHEALYRLMLADRWVDALRLVHRHRAAQADDPLLTQADERLLDTLFDRLARDPSDDRDPLPHEDEVLETLFLLHTGRFYRLSDARIGTVAARLAQRHADDPAASVSYARRAPEHPVCAEVLRAAAEGQSRRVSHTQADAVDVSVAASEASHADARVPLFKSTQEVDFFLAAREVFATYLVYPNVALSTLFSFEALQPQLSAEARRYFFRAVIDCVVFDQHDDYRPRYFFELDSAYHDPPDQQARDRRKDQIVAAAGQRLYRIRPRTAGDRRGAFAQVLREVVA